jgi:hypothetical protein
MNFSPIHAWASYLAGQSLCRDWAWWLIIMFDNDKDKKFLPCAFLALSSVRAGIVFERFLKG